MLTIAFCSRQESMLTHIPQELMKGFSRRDMDAQVLTAHTPRALLQYAQQGIYPDIIIFSNSIITKAFLNTLLFLKEQKPSVIFILSEDSESFNHSVEDNYVFLLHPFYSTCSSSWNALWSCVCKAYDSIRSDRNTFSYYHRPSYHSTPLSHILYFASERRCIRLVTKDSSDSFYGKLSELEDCLSSKNCSFIRVHQSYLVNQHYITSFNRKYILLANGELLPISKSKYYHALLKSECHSTHTSIAKTKIKIS